jgi:hypothetical protein
MLLVEDFSRLTFCSDPCIQQFYNHLILYYEKEEKDFRKKLSLSKESCFIFKENQLYVQQTLEQPQEIFEVINDVGHKSYTFLRRFEDEDFPFFMIMKLFLYQKVPSFVFFQTVTNVSEVLDFYRVGEKVDNIEDFFQLTTREEKEPGPNEIQVEMPQKELDDLERKKSTLLADLLMKRSTTDIPFENFHLYEPFIPSTIDNPDEVYSFNDEEGDEILVYLKGHIQSGVSFYYIVLCKNLELDKQDQNQEVLFPILAFPTLDGKLTRYYCQGEKLSGNLKN